MEQKYIKRLTILIIVIMNYHLHGQDKNNRIDFPVKPEIILAGDFNGCEGIAFNGEGRLFVTGAKKLWEITIEGKAKKVADLYSNLGIAAYGKRDLLVADFGPTNAFRHGRNSDGIIWRISPEGKKEKIVNKGIGDPNFIYVLKDRSFLISDDATNDIFRVDIDKNLSLFSTAVNHPNGIALSKDGKTLYVAQIFKSIKPVILDNKVWSIKLDEGEPTKSGAKLVVRTGPNAANDGLAMDKLGRIYIAANGEGKIWRFNPETEEMVLITDNVFGVASIAFGEGQFDKQSIYFTSTFANGRGGKVYKAFVGVEGVKLYK